MRSFLTPLPRDAITALYVALALGVSLGVIGFLIDMLELWRTNSEDRVLHVEKRDRLTKASSPAATPSSPEEAKVSCASVAA